MPKSPNASSPFAKTGDVIDVEYEHVDAQGRTIEVIQPVENRKYGVPPVRDKLFASSDSSGQGGRLGLFSSQNAQRRPVLRVSRFAFAGLVTVFSLMAFWVAGGHVIVTWLGGTSGDRSLTLSNVSTLPDRVGGESALVVHGQISNPTETALEVPLIAIETDAGKAAGDAPLFVRAQKEKLAAGESTRFRVRVSRPSRGHKELTITLAGGGAGR